VAAALSSDVTVVCAASLGEDNVHVAEKGGSGVGDVEDAAGRGPC